MPAEPKAKPVSPLPRVDIWHFILWSRYKARVFSALWRVAQSHGADFRFFQFATTDSTRRSLGDADPSVHDYPYTLLFEGSFEDVPAWRMMLCSGLAVWNSKADIIVLQCYNKPEYWLQLLLGKLHGKRMVVFSDATVFDNPQTKMKRLLKRTFFSLCSGAICYGERSVAYVRSLGMAPDRIWVRCQAPALPQDYSAAAALRDRLGVPASPQCPRFLYVGRLISIKRVDVLIKAFSKVRAELSNAHLQVVGDGPERSALEALTNSLRLANAVSFCGVRVDESLWQEYLRADVLVLPSDSEPWGLVVNEAMSFGCPAIVSERCGCAPEMVVPGKTGFIFRASDEADLAVKLLESRMAFAERSVTAEACIAQASLYTSERSAQQIYDACMGVSALS